MPRGACAVGMVVAALAVAGVALGAPASSVVTKDRITIMVSSCSGGHAGVSGEVTRSGKKAGIPKLTAGVVVTIRAGKTRTSIKRLLGTATTNSAGAYSFTVEIAGHGVVFLRASTPNGQSSPFQALCTNE